MVPWHISVNILSFLHPTVTKILPLPLFMVTNNLSHLHTSPIHATLSPTPSPLHTVTNIPLHTPMSPKSPSTPHCHQHPLHPPLSATPSPPHPPTVTNIPLYTPLSPKSPPHPTVSCPLNFCHQHPVLFLSLQYPRVIKIPFHVPPSQTTCPSTSQCHKPV